MRNLELLPIDEETRTTIRTSRDKLLAYAGIKVDILDFTGDTVKIRVEQTELKNNWLLNQYQLTARAGAVFSPLQRKYKLHFVALTYAPDLAAIDAKWVETKMKGLGLSRNDVIKQMGIDKVTLSQMFTGVKELTKFHKAAFFYYLLTYELNRDFRNYLNQQEA